MSNSAMSVVILAADNIYPHVAAAASGGEKQQKQLVNDHTLAGKPMVQHVIDAANMMGARQVHLVYGHGGDLVFT